MPAPSTRHIEPLLSTSIKTSPISGSLTFTGAAPTPIISVTPISGTVTMGGVVPIAVLPQPTPVQPPLSTGAGGGGAGAGAFYRHRPRNQLVPRSLTVHPNPKALRLDGRAPYILTINGLMDMEEEDEEMVMLALNHFGWL